MLHYDALRQLTHERRLHHEAEAEAERLARRLPLAREVEQPRATPRRAIRRAGLVVVTVWPRR